MSTSRSPLRHVPGDHDKVSTTYGGLASDVRPDDRLLVNDGKIELRVLDVDGDDVTL